MKSAIVNHLHVRKERGQSPHGSRFSRAAITEYHNAADRGIDRCHQERVLHFVLTDNCRKRKCL
jgi:hypothetical protein